jgi:hypothetical protein
MINKSKSKWKNNIDLDLENILKSNPGMLEGIIKDYGNMDKFKESKEYKEDK